MQAILSRWASSTAAVQILNRDDSEAEKKGGKLHKLQKPLNQKLQSPQLSSASDVYNGIF